MKAIGYARVSSKEQSYTQALEQQIQRLKAAGATEIITDVESGKKDHRSGFAKLTHLISTEPVTVIATRCDRLTRSLITLRHFFSLCEFHKATVIVLDDNIDTSTAAGKFHLNMLGALAEMESDRISERVKHGHAYHRQRKAVYFPIFGYIKVGDRLELDKADFLCCDGKVWSKFDIARFRIETFLQVGSIRKVAILCNQKFGVSCNSEIGKKKNLALTSGFSRWITNPILRGHIAYNRGANVDIKYEDEWELVLNAHEPILSESEWQIIRGILDNNNKRKKNFTSAKHPFSGLIRCAVCKGCCVAKHNCRKAGIKISYQCRLYRSRACPEKHHIYEDKVRSIVINNLIKYSSSILALEESSAPTGVIPNQEILALESQLNELLKIPNPSTPIETAIGQLRQQIENKSAILSLEFNTYSQQRQELIDTFKTPDFWAFLESQLTPVEARSYYHKWIKAIWIRDGEIIGIDFSLSNF